MAFKIITDSSANLTNEMVKELGVKVLSISLIINEEEVKSYEEDSEFDYVSFYETLRSGEHIKTSLVNSDTFFNEFEKILKNGEDVLVLTISSGISGTYQAARVASDMAREKYPDRQVIVIDSLAASIGQGLLVYYAAMLQKEGKSIEEVSDWLYKNRLKMVHNFTVDDLFFLKRGGRLSGGVAVIGTILQIRPILHVDNDGHLVTIDKVNGRKKSLNKIFETFKENVTNPEEQVIAICHGDCLEDAEYLAKKIKNEYNVKDVIIDYCGPVLAAHSGPGTLALFYLADKR